MGIKLKLILSYLALALIVAIVGVFHMQSNTAATAEFDEIASEDAPALIALGHLKVASLKLVRAAISTALIQLEAEKASSRARYAEDTAKEAEAFEQARRDINKGLAEFAALTQPSEGQGIIQKIRENAKLLYGAGLHLITLRAETGKSEALLQARQVLGNVEEEFLTLLDRAIALKLTAFETHRESAEQEALYALLVNAALFIVAAGFAVDFGLMLAKAIANPVIALKEAAAAVGQGQLDTRVDIPLKDEIGELANSFNMMAADLERSHSALQQAYDELEFRVQARTAELARANTTLQEEIFERQRAEAEREELNKQLVDASRHAGMAEVATHVLHNVGNVLNSVNVSAGVITNTVRQSPVDDISRIGTMLQQHAQDLGHYLTSHPKGKHIPGYLTKLGGHLVQEHNLVLKEIELFTSNIEHINRIIGLQQTLAKAVGVEEPVLLTEVMEQALGINMAALERHQVEIVRDYTEIPCVITDRHQVLQILVNLISNAKYAMQDMSPVSRVLTVRVGWAEGQTGMVQLQVSDTGIGIKPEHLTHIFSQGFTTRANGHGFGLHSGALSARQLGGSLSVRSDGESKGAAFTLELPTNMERLAA